MLVSCSPCLSASGCNTNSSPVQEMQDFYLVSYLDYEPDFCLDSNYVVDLLGESVSARC